MYQFMCHAPGKGKGAARPCIGTIYYPSVPTQQDEKDTLMAGVENMNTSTPVPPVDSEAADTGLSWMVTSSTASNTSQGSLEQPAPLRRSTWNNLELTPMEVPEFWYAGRYSPSGIWDALVGLCICLHVISCMYTVFWGSTV